MIVEHGFLGDAEKVEPLPGAVEAVRRLNGWGYLVIGLSNQSGVARGYYGVEAVERVNTRVRERFAREGAVIERIYYCPHLPEGDIPEYSCACDCRKPATGMVRQAERDFRIDLSRSFVVGDRECDVAMAQNLGVPGILVLTGYGTEERNSLPTGIEPVHFADDLLAAVDWWGKKHARI